MQLLNEQAYLAMKEAIAAAVSCMLERWVLLYTLVSAAPCCAAAARASASRCRRTLLSMRFLMSVTLAFTKPPRPETQDLAAAKSCVSGRGGFVKASVTDIKKRMDSSVRRQRDAEARAAAAQQGAAETKVYNRTQRSNMHETAAAIASFIAKYACSFNNCISGPAKPDWYCVLYGRGNDSYFLKIMKTAFICG